MKQKRMQRKGVENTEQKVAAKVDENEEAEEAGQENSDLTVGDEAEKNAKKGLEEWGRRRRRRRRRDRRRRDRRRRDRRRRDRRRRERRRRERRRRSRRRRSRRRANPNDCSLPALNAGTNTGGCSGTKEVRTCRLACNSGYYGTPHASCATNGGRFAVKEQCLPNAITQGWTEIVVVAVRAVDQTSLNSDAALKKYCPDGTRIISPRSIDHVRWATGAVLNAGFDLSQAKGFPFAKKVGNNYKNLFNGLDITAIIGNLGHDHQLLSGKSGVLVGLGWAASKSDVRMKGFNYNNNFAAVVCEK